MDKITHPVSPDLVTAQRGPGTDIAMSRLALLAVLFAAVPLIITQPAPLEDWPSHLARVDIVYSLLHGEPFWAQYYHLNTFLLPNVALDVALAGLHATGLSIATAGMVFLLATYALFVTGGVRLAAAFGAPDPVKPPIMAMLFYNSALMGGFANYMFGIGLAFCVLAAWIGARERPWRRLAIAVVGTVAVFFAHLIAAGFLIAVMGLFELHALARQRRFDLGASVREASAAAAGAVAVILFALSPISADGPGGGAVTYTGAPSLGGIAKGKLILLFHPLLDGSGTTGAAIVVAGMGLFLLLALRTGHPRLSQSAWFVAAGLAVPGDRLSQRHRRRLRPGLPPCHPAGLRRGQRGDPDLAWCRRTLAGPWGSAGDIGCPVRVLYRRFHARPSDLSWLRGRRRANSSRQRSADRDGIALGRHPVGPVLGATDGIPGHHGDRRRCLRPDRFRHRQPASAGAKSRVRRLALVRLLQFA